MLDFDQNDVDSSLEKCKIMESELVEKLNAIRSHIKSLNQIKIEIFTYEDSQTKEIVNQENRQIDELTREPMSDQRMNEVAAKVIPAVQAL